ncbi:hypothetical protein PI125_g24740 [Phytophthora idaei]|nr:hypothetical protein PI125_g24740 [Phytophthora idaei]
MDASDGAVLDAGNPSSNSASVAAGTSHRPIALSEGSASSPEPAQDDDVDLAPASGSACEQSQPSHRKRLRSHVFGSDGESDDESSQPSSQALSRTAQGVLLPLGRTQCLRAARRLLHDSDNGAGSSASAPKFKRHNSELHQVPTVTGSRRNTSRRRSTKSTTPRPLLLTQFRPRRLPLLFSFGSSACRPPAFAVGVTNPILSSCLEGFSDDGSDDPAG